MTNLARQIADVTSNRRSAGDDRNSCFRQRRHRTDDRRNELCVVRIVGDVGLHLHERSDPKDFPRGSAGTGRQPAERPGWGTPDSIGHYVDFGSAVLGLTMFPAGYLGHTLTRRDGSPRF
jgi:hypothetical protein